MSLIICVYHLQNMSFNVCLYICIYVHLFKFTKYKTMYIFFQLRHDLNGWIYFVNRKHTQVDLTKLARCQYVHMTSNWIYAAKNRN